MSRSDADRALERRTWLSLGAVACVAALVGLPLAWDRLPESAPPQGVSGPNPPGAAAAPEAAPELVARGRYLAQIGNCAGCHTARGGAPLAGGAGLATPFGTVYAGNLTPDAATGLGAWNADDFWRALHHGRGRDGRRLLPAFPYTEYTHIRRADSDALFAYLRSLPAVKRSAPPQALRGLYDSAWALAVWRTLFFRPAEWQDDPAHDARWNRGAYLVNGLGHCAACHGGRNALGAARAGFGGGAVPLQGWYAPSLTRADEAGVAQWPEQDVVALLRDGVAPQGRANGPMAHVVRQSTQYMTPTDLAAMATYLRTLGEAAGAPPPAPAVAGTTASPADKADAAQRQRGERLYGDHCADCHGAQGEGARTAAGATAAPALAGNRLVVMEPPTNLLRVILSGGFGAGTAADPRPFGMPPFAHALSDEQLADIATYLRQAWGAAAAPVSALAVAHQRGDNPP